MCCSASVGGGYQVENQIFKGHRIILTTRSRVFKALLSSGMREDEEGEVVIHDVRAPVFKVWHAHLLPWIGVFQRMGSR